MIKGVYFDFGYVIGYPKSDIRRRNLYLNWDGLQNILTDKELMGKLKKDVDIKTLEGFFVDEIYKPFVEREKSDLVDPRSEVLLKNNLHKIFDGVIDDKLIDNILMHINTMKYLYIYKNTINLLSEIKSRGYCISMISNMMLPGKLLLDLLKEKGILNYFNTITISSDAGYIKPHKELFIQTLKKDNLKPDEVLFVGDTFKQDIIGAKSVGMKTVWLNCRKEQVDNKEAVDYEINELIDLIKILDIL